MIGQENHRQYKSMYKLKILISLLFTGGVLYSAGTMAQTTVEQSDFQYITNSQNWLNSRNAAGLYALPAPHISYAEVSFEKENGKFVNYYQSDDQYSLGLNAESYLHLNPKVVLYGNIEYLNFQGKNMSGSAFLDPYQQPFDIVEYSDEHAGTKDLEKYVLEGAVGVQLSDRWKLGGRFDYMAANYSKRKDLRHKNLVMNLQAGIGGIYRINRSLEIGANYTYRRNTEGLTFGSYGNVDRQYWSLINFGAFMGYKELFSDAGYTEDNANIPMIDQSHGVSIQVVADGSDRLQWFNEFSYASRSGYYGTDADEKIQYTTHDATSIDYSGRLSLKESRHLHTLSLQAGQEELDNYENINQRITSTETGNSYYKRIGKTKTLHRKRNRIQAGYRKDIDIKGHYPLWTVEAQGEYRNQQLTSSLPPYYRKQTINSYRLTASALRNILKDEKSMYTFHLATHYGFGNGTPKDDGIYSTSQTDIKEPAKQDDYLWLEYEYLTASRAGIQLGAKYSRQLSASLIYYIALDGTFTQAFNIQHVKGSNRMGASLRVGCNF